MGEGGDVSWAIASGHPVYLGVEMTDGVRIGVCNPDSSCPNVGWRGAKPSRLVQ